MKHEPVRTIEPQQRSGQILVLLAGDETPGAVHENFVRHYLDALLLGARFLDVKLSVLHGTGEGVSTVAAAWSDLNGVEHQAVASDTARWGAMASQLADREMMRIGNAARAAGWAVRAVGFPLPGRSAGWGLVNLARAAGMTCDIEVESPEARRAGAEATQGNRPGR